MMQKEMKKREQNENNKRVRHLFRHTGRLKQLSEAGTSGFDVCSFDISFLNP